MNSLINITTNEQGSQVVSARELREFLNVNTHVSTWINRLVDKYSFEESVDFSILKSGNANGGIDRIDDFALTLDMAKEVSMLQGNDKGKQARKYFIDSEKQLKAIQEDRFSIPQTFADALRLAVDLEEQKQKLSDKNLMLNAAIEEQKPKVQLANHIMSDDVTTHKVGQVAKILYGRGIPVMGSKNLYKEMRAFGMVFKGSTEPMQSAVNSGYLALKVNEIVGNNGRNIIKKQTLITNKGIEYLFKKMYKDCTQSNLFN